MLAGRVAAWEASLAARSSVCGTSVDPQGTTASRTVLGLGGNGRDDFGILSDHKVFKDDGFLGFSTFRGAVELSEHVELRGVSHSKFRTLSMAPICT